MKRSRLSVIRERLSSANSAYAPAGIRLVNPRLPPSRQLWRRIHNRYRTLTIVLSTLAVALSAIQAWPQALPAMVLYIGYIVAGEFALRWLGGERFYSTLAQSIHIALYLCLAAILMWIVYRYSPSDSNPQAAGLWLIVVLAILPAARYLDTTRLVVATVLGSLVLIAATLLPLGARGSAVFEPGVILPLVAANVAWLGTLAYTFRIALRTLASREQGFEDALTTLNNLGADRMSAQAVCAEAVKRIARRGLYEYALIALYDEESVGPDDAALEIVAVAGASSPVSSGLLVGFTYPVTRGITGRAVSARSAQLVNDVTRDVEKRFLPHPSLPNVKAECAVPILLGERVLGVLDVESTQANAFEREDIDLLQLFATQLALVLAEAQQMEIQSSLRQAMQHILSAGSVRSMMEQLAERANRVLKADSTIIYLCEPTKDVWQGPYWSGDVADPGHLQRGHLHTDSMLRWLIEWPEAVYARDGKDLLNLARQGQRHADTHEFVFLIRQNVRSVAAAPLRAGEAPVGVMFINYRRERKLGRAFRDMTNAFFDLAGVAALNCHLQAQARSAGRQDALEDLHDGLSQIVNYQIRTRLQQIRDSNWLVEQPHARQAVADIERAVTTASDLVRRLKDRPDHGQPMGEMFCWIARNLSGVASGATCRIPPAVRDDHRLVRGWMAEEVNYIVLQAVANAVEHAQAGTIDVDVQVRDARLSVSIADDGHGFEVDQAPSHRGLYNMRNRATKLGGHLHIDSSRGSGTRVTLDLPLDVLLRPADAQPDQDRA